ncbi:MAG: dual specificity protein phosphatase 23 [Nitrososphaerales archaeon]|jgi:atypical dual specificity phosphatase
MSKPGNLWRKIHGKITKRPTNFSWLIEDKLAGCGMPTSLEEMNWIRSQGVKSIITMTEDSLPNPWLNEIEYLHVPTEDLTAPDLEKIDSAVDYIDERIKNKEPVMVHCAAGIGRTGTILASYLIKYQKMTAKDAIEKLRNERPGSVQSEIQEMAVSMYEKYLKHKD